VRPEKTLGNLPQEPPAHLTIKHRLTYKAYVQVVRPFPPLGFAILLVSNGREPGDVFSATPVPPANYFSELLR
jgi:hypothetical protein